MAVEVAPLIWKKNFLRKIFSKFSAKKNPINLLEGRIEPPAFACNIPNFSAQCAFGRALNLELPDDIFSYVRLKYFTLKNAFFVAKKNMQGTADGMSRRIKAVLAAQGGHTTSPYGIAPLFLHFNPRWLRQ